MASNHPQRRSSSTVIIAAMAAVIVLLVTVIIVLVTRSSRSTSPDAKETTAATKKPAAYVEDAHLMELREGIDQLRGNMQAYIECVPEYEAGLIRFEDGKLEFAPGQLQLDQGYADYDAGQQLDKGQKTLNENEDQYAAALKQYNDGVALIEANTQSYNEGKALLAQIEPLLPYLNMYQSFRNGELDTLSSLPNGQIGGMLFTDAQAWYVSVVLPLGTQLDRLALPADVLDFPGYISQIVAEGKAQMKAYEDGLAMLEAAKPQIEAARMQLDDGHVAYSEGQAALEAGAAQLRDGEAQLSDEKVLMDQYESGEEAMVAEILKLMAHPKVTKLLSGDAYFGTAYNADDLESLLWAKDANGNFIILNGHKLIDLDACETVIDAAQEYRNTYTGEGSPWD